MANAATLKRSQAAIHAHPNPPAPRHSKAAPPAPPPPPSTSPCSPTAAASARPTGRLRRPPERGVFVVCDGMGGAAAGEVASHLACKPSSRLSQPRRDLASCNRHPAPDAPTRRHPQRRRPYPANHPTPASRGRPRRQHAVFRHSRRITQRCTAWAPPWSRCCWEAVPTAPTPAVWLAHVGDSRCYRLRRGALAPAHPRPLPRRGAGPRRPAQPHPGRVLAHPQHHHPRHRLAARRRARDRRPPHPARRPLPARLRRPHPRAQRRRDRAHPRPRRSARCARRGRPPSAPTTLTPARPRLPRPHRRRQRQRRRRQHHRPPGPLPLARSWRRWKIAERPVP